MYFLGHDFQASHVVFSLLFLYSYTFLPLFSQFNRTAEDKLSTPKLLCNYLDNITRLVGCSTQLVESIVFPHNSRNPWWREVPLFDGQSINATSISVKKQGRPKNFIFDESARIMVPSSQSNDSVTFDLSKLHYNQCSHSIRRWL